MDILTVLLDPVFPVAAIAVLGYVLGRRGHLAVDDARLINRLSMTVFLPLLLFDLLANAPIHSFRLLPLMAYQGVEALVFTLGYLLARRVFQRPADESFLLGFTAIFANNAFFVLPIAMLLYGAENILAITSIIALDSTVTFAGSMIVLQIVQLGRVKPRVVGMALLKTPMLHAIVFGLIFAAFRLPVPGSLQTFATFNGAAAAPVALFAFGVVMAQTKLHIDATVFTYTLLKLLIFPFVVWLSLTTVVPVTMETDLFVMGAAGPSGTMAFSLALLYGVRTETISQIIIWTSLLSLITLSALA
jgi:malonate transporter